MQRDFIELDPTEIPVEFEIELGEETFIMTINYNESYDFYTVDLYDLEEIPLVLGEKLVLNQPLFSAFTDDRLPAQSIVPFDESQKAERITKDNFYQTVFLTIDDGGDDDE